ncbi:MAG: 16S rRNA (adenine(1518)-N(6)/adenine(1519)-N(6))-dimethyltransferase RsmA [candidate division Zixibacteria bacterium]|nr:16S rRNA (adenine(1518)-N(6)/adenine(1519)-N(6))-dimethyltransferase RsmA [candidate division Zixibacteria bacterium]MDD5426945.1 16S rRNA (adenine(1518)-N(6)/adenine(1519)-N(6))-dimethyltransferase RsmA [candidate division Zixibacteria bacterium]
MPPYHPKKRLGQHFLNAPAVINAVIERVNPAPGQNIIEIGPGQGVLTIPLAESGASVLAVEFDEDLMRGLKKITATYHNVKILCLDFLEFDPDNDTFASFKLVGNIPYNITSPVIDWCIRHYEVLDSAVLMVQKEIAERLAASPGNKNWSPLSIFTRLYFTVKKLFDVPPESFYPPPEVHSAVVELVPRIKVNVPDFKLFERVVRQSFLHRRKLLINNLVPDIITESKKAESIFSELGFKDNLRAEELSIEQFLKLTNYLISHNII